MNSDNNHHHWHIKKPPTLAALDDEFAFVARCNLGGEAMADADLERLRQIAARTWTRTLDDRLGVSWEENQRQARTPAPELPVQEPLLADKPEHLFERPDSELIAPDNPWGFKLDVPTYKHNRGELYNLGIARGTLTAEERYIINNHIVQTIRMLDHLPFPKHLANVAEIAGGHHEKMDGSGYPRHLMGEAISPMGRILLLAEVVTAFYEKYTDMPAQRLSLVLRLNHRKFPAALVAHVLPLLQEDVARDSALMPLGADAPVHVTTTSAAARAAPCAALPCSGSRMTISFCPPSLPHVGNFTLLAFFTP